MQQLPGNPPPQQYSRGMQFFIGIIIGVVPLVLGLLSLSSSGSMISNLFSAAVIGYMVGMIASIICVCIPRVRFLGYGLLTMVGVSPVVFFIACTVVVFRV